MKACVVHSGRQLPPQRVAAPGAGAAGRPVARTHSGRSTAAKLYRRLMCHRHRARWGQPAQVGDPLVFRWRGWRLSLVGTTHTEGRCNPHRGQEGAQWRTSMSGVRRTGERPRAQPCSATPLCLPDERDEAQPTLLPRCRTAPTSTSRHQTGLHTSLHCRELCHTTRCHRSVISSNIDTADAGLVSRQGRRKGNRQSAYLHKQVDSKRNQNGHKGEQDSGLPLRNAVGCQKRLRSRRPHAP